MNTEEISTDNMMMEILEGAPYFDDNRVRALWMIFRLLESGREVDRIIAEVEVLFEETREGV